jgi:hypothetical protein
MTAIEQTKLHRFVWRHVGDELRSDLVPRRTAVDKIVLYRPLLERLVHYRRGVVQAQRGIVIRNVGFGRRGHDAIDHRRRKAGLFGDPSGQRRVAHFGEGENQPPPAPCGAAGCQLAGKGATVQASRIQRSAIN